MSEKLFFSQELINSWCDDQRVKFENDTLTMQTPRGVREYLLTQAYRVLRVAGGGEDAAGIVGKVLTREELLARGADLCLDSCIIGDTPYEIEQGYFAVKAEDEQSIEEMLMDYLAKTLI